MKFELCSSGERESKQKLCLPCLEAVARLWTIANRAAEVLAGPAVTGHGAASSKDAPVIAMWPNSGCM